MAETRATIDAAGCLGRFLTVLGLIWIGLVVLGGMGLLAELGFSGGFLAGVGGTVVPGIMLLVAGRALRRRSLAGAPDRSPTSPTASTPATGPTGRSSSDIPRPAQKAPIPFPGPDEPRLPEPTPAPTTEPTPAPTTEPTRASGTEPLATPATVPAKARPRTGTTPGQVVPPATEATERPAGTSARPKTSAEMIEEAHRRWGGSKP